MADVRAGCHQWNVRDGLPERQPVADQPCLTERLAMVSCHHNDGRIENAGPIQRADDPAHEMVGVPDLGAVARFKRSRAFSLRRL